MTTRQAIQQIIWLPWTLWCALVFAVALVIAFPVVVIVVLSRNEKWIYKLHFVPPVFARAILFLWGIKIEEVNRQLSEPHRQTIFVSNHMSYLDGIVAAAVIPNFTKYLGKAEILDWPVLGYIMKHLYVAVQRDDEADRQRSMIDMTEKLKTGASFFICPEGTCNTTPQLLKYFHGGAFRLAIDNNLPLVPFTFIGTHLRFPRKGLMLHPGKVVVYWHKPIDTSVFTKADVEALKTTVRVIMQNDLLAHFPEGKYENATDAE